MRENFQDGALFVTHVFLRERLYVLFVKVLDDCLNADLDYNILVDRAFPQVQLLLLKLERVSDFRVCRDLRVDKFGIVDATAVKVVVVSNHPHLVLAE